MVTGTKKLSRVIGVLLALVMIIVSAVPTFAATSVGSVKTLKASNNGKNVITLKWSKASHATSYRVYKKKGSKYVRIKTLKSRTYKTKISRTTYFKVRGVRKTKLGKMSKAVKAAYKKQSKPSKKPLLTTAEGVKVYKGRTYSLEKLGVPRGDRSVKVMYGYTYGSGDTKSGIVVGKDSETGKYLAVNLWYSDNPKYMSGLLYTYDALSKYDAGYTRWTGNGFKNYFDFIDQPGYEVIEIKDPGITFYETIDGTKPTPDNYYLKITKADGVVNTYNWMGHKGYEWFAAYKNGKIVFEEITRHVPVE
jgi:hypothetical protein